MYCTKCGVQVAEGSRFCAQCGTPVAGAVPLNTGGRRFERSATDKKIAGVCAGVARYFGMDVTLVRILWIIFTIWPPPLGLIAYLICWAVMPVEPVRVAPTNEAQTV